MSACDPARLAIILNPAAGRGRGRRALPSIRAALAADSSSTATLYQTHRDQSVAALVNTALHAGHGTLLAAGGDGTMHAVAGAVLDWQHAHPDTPPPRLALLPLGTGCDFVQSLPPPATNDLATLLQHCRTAPARPLDALRLHLTTTTGTQQTWAINSIGLGIDATVAAASTRVPFLTGQTPYLLAAAWALCVYRPPRMCLTWEGGTHNAPLLLATLANGRRQGGGFWFTPDARVDDGRLDGCLVPPLPLRTLPLAIVRAMHGSHGSLPTVQMLRAQAVTVNYHRPALVVADGEILAQDVVQLEVAVVPRVLSVITG